MKMAPLENHPLENHRGWNAMYWRDNLQFTCLKTMGHKFKA